MRHRANGFRLPLLSSRPPTPFRMRLLLLSNSTNPGQAYLDHAVDWLRHFLGEGVRRVLFVPFAGVTISFDDYAGRVRERLEPLGYAVESLHAVTCDLGEAVTKAEAVLVGGGNSFHLLDFVYRHHLLDPLRARVADGMPYVGWSAGSNLACPTIRTTNDMPIVEPPTLDALGLIPFQINPHYTDAHPPGHQGETRAQRLLEFVAVNPTLPVAGLPEGTALRVEGARIEKLGPHPVRLFAHGEEPREVAERDLSFLLSA